MPVKGKADFMFVQHMVASTNNAGRMAVVMPHGVLFRGGEEREFRKWLIDKGYLEAVIGMPSGLFYGTGIPASVIVVNKKDAHLREKVLFINADREYKEGKNQNKLRPEDIEKISFVYKHKEQINKYSRLVSKQELENEEYNLNIRRFVDNAPPAEPHDVHAHLKGGIPVAEVDALNQAFSSYPGLRNKLFTELKENYLRFTDDIAEKEDIKKLLDESPEVQTTLDNYTKGLEKWWNEAVVDFRKLPETNNVFELYGKFSDSFAQALFSLPFGEKNNGAVLDKYQSRGALAAYWDELKTDLRSVAASGWNAELIPDDEILQSQFPDVLKELHDNQNRKEELDALFAEVNELEEGVWSEEEYDVWPKTELKDHKDAIKEEKGELRETNKEYKNLLKRIKANQRALKKQPELAVEIETLQKQADKVKIVVDRLSKSIADDEQRFAKHTELASELKECKKVIKQIKDRKQQLVDEARLKITPEEAKALILDRWNRILHQTINGYLQAHSRKLLQNIENLWDKYTTTLNSILGEREKETQLLNSFLTELGYE